MSGIRMTAVTVVALAAAIGGGGAVAVADTRPAALQLGHFAVNNFGTDQGWRAERHVRAVADITGDRRADIIGFGNAGVFTAVATGGGSFGPATLVLPAFGLNHGWLVDRHDRFVTDITGDGRADVVGIGEAGVLTAVATGDGGFGGLTLHQDIFSASRCQYRRVADVNGDGRSDLYCIADRRIEIAIARGDGGFAAPILATSEFPLTGPAFTNLEIADVTGDRRAEILALIVSGNQFVFLSTSPRADGTYDPAQFGNSEATGFPDRVSDVTGDGRADLVMFTDVTYVGRSFGNGTFASFRVGINDYGLNGSWTRRNHERHVNDVTGDRRGDIVGFGDAGVYLSSALGDSTFAGQQFMIADFGYHQGWRPGQNPRFVVDITGDDRADIVGFGTAGVFIAVSQGGVFV
jgi:hypothetical protein